MSIRKFRYDQASGLQPGDTVSLSRDEEKHLFKILRAEPGDEVELLDGAGLIASAVVGADRLLTVSAIHHFQKPQKRLHLYLAPPRRQKMDVILHQAAELGVWRIVPVSCAFGVSDPDEKSISGHWNDALFESCKQSGNPFLPEVSAKLSFAEAVKDALIRNMKCFYGAAADAPEITLPDYGDIAWFVGPEGGFSPAELRVLNESAVPLHIGRWILRVETAAVAGIVRLS